jgi:hypothetical protein
MYTISLGSSGSTGLHRLEPVARIADSQPTAARSVAHQHLKNSLTLLLLELYDVEVSAALISKVTDAVIEKVVEWQSRPLDSIYPIVYLDCILVKIQQDKQVINKAIYLALLVIGPLSF